MSIHDQGLPTLVMVGGAGRTMGLETGDLLHVTRVVYSEHALKNVPHGTDRKTPTSLCMSLHIWLTGQTQPTILPRAIPAGAEEFTAVGAEVTERGDACGAGMLLSGGNIRSCFLTFNFLR